MCAALAFLVGLAYWPVRLNGFVNYDDQEYLTQNAVVQAGLTREGVVWAFRTNHSANWHPLTWLSHMLDCQVFGLQPTGHHLVSVALHAANSLLLFLLLRRMTGAHWRSAFVAALFALHPLHVESVAWAAERKDVLNTFFGLLSLHAYVGYTNGTRRKPATYSLALFFFACSLLSKPMLVTLPFLLLLLDWWPLGRLNESRAPGLQIRSRGWPRLLLEKAPFLALSIVSCVITLRVQQKAMTFYQELPLGLRLANALVTYGRYLGKTFWPQDLAVFYPYPPAWPVASIFAAALLVIAIAAAAALNGRTRPWLGFGWLWYCGLLAPVLGLVQVGVQSMADRYTYLPLVGIFMIAAWAGAELLARSPAPLRMAAGGMALLACTMSTRAQLGYWRDTESLFTHAIAVTDRNWVAHYNLASLALARYQDTQRSGVQQQTGSRTALTSAGGEYLQQVVRHCQATLAAMPDFADPRITLAKALTELGELDGARDQLKTAVRLQPDNPEARENLAEILYRTGATKAAVEEYRAALRLRADWPPVENNLAWVLAADPEDAIRNGMEAVRLASRACAETGSTNLWYLHTLAASYAETGDFTNAVATAEQAFLLAHASGHPDLAKTATERLELYRSGRPLRAH